MPIGDLLAEISGGEPSSVPLGVKRKAGDDLESAALSKATKVTKAQNQDDTSSSARIVSSTVTRPSAVSHRTNIPSSNGRYEPPIPGSQRTPTSNSANGRAPAGSSGISRTRQSSDFPRPKPNPSTSAASKVPAARPSPTTPNAVDLSRAPKKGSFAEIMARGAKAQQTMGKVGVIQHKAIDKSIGKKEREAIQLEPKSGLKGRAGQQYRGNARPSSTPSRDGRRAGAKVGESSRNGSAKGAREVSKPRPGPSREETPEKKIKKSATATTGYTGTARPRPGASSAKSSSRGEQRGKASRDGGLLAPPGARRRDRYEEEEDEDMDDFIEYDDEDDEPGPRGRGYGYDSDGSSDMEAGLSDIDGEEARAERAARDEDRREQQLEEKLKREKEERRRRWAQSGR